MASSFQEQHLRVVQKEILTACRAVYPKALRSWEADSLWARVRDITKDERHYALGGQQAFYEALNGLESSGWIDVNRGTAGMFEASITQRGISELENME